MGGGGDVTRILRCFYNCQLVDKPNQRVPEVSMTLILSVEPPLFTRVLVDLVGHLSPPSAGNKYLLTIMDVTTWYPESMSISSAKAKPVVQQLISFFTKFAP